MIKDNLAKIRCQIQEACARAGRSPAEITLVAISKNRGIEEIKEAVSCGITDIGENRVQEALLKFNLLRTPDSVLRTHMVGHLQANKVQDAVRIFDLIHSVDSLRLAEEIDKQVRKINKIQDVLLEIKTSPEETKYGINPEGAVEAAGKIAKLKNVRLCGLMTIAPLVDKPEEARPYFRILRELRDKLLTSNSQLQTLSTGMTDDFQIAIEEGATMLRLGRAIFEG